MTWRWVYFCTLLWCVSSRQEWLVWTFAAEDAKLSVREKQKQQPHSHPSKCGNVLQQGPWDTMNFTCAVSLLGHRPCPHLHPLPTPMAAGAICQALVFLWRLCLTLCHAVCLVSLSTYTTDPFVTAWNPSPSPLSCFFAPLIHVQPV